MFAEIQTDDRDVAARALLDQLDSPEARRITVERDGSAWRLHIFTNLDQQHLAAAESAGSPQ